MHKFETKKTIDKILVPRVATYAPRPAFPVSRPHVVDKHCFFVYRIYLCVPLKIDNSVRTHTEKLIHCCPAVGGL